MTAIQRTTEYVRHRPYGAVFSFEQVTAKAGSTPDSVSHALNKLASDHMVTRLAPGIWHRPKRTRFGVVGPPPEAVVALLARKHRALIRPAGAAALNALGWSTQMSMAQSYVSTHRIRCREIGGQVIRIEYKSSFARAMAQLEGLGAEEKRQVATLWIALEYVGAAGAKSVRVPARRSLAELSPRAREQFLACLNGKMRWARVLLMDGGHDV